MHKVILMLSAENQLLLYLLMTKLPLKTYFYLERHFPEAIRIAGKYILPLSIFTRFVSKFAYFYINNMLQEH